MSWSDANGTVARACIWHAKMGWRGALRRRVPPLSTPTRARNPQLGRSARQLDACSCRRYVGSAAFKRQLQDVVVEARPWPCGTTGNATANSSGSPRAIGASSKLAELQRDQRPDQPHLAPDGHSEASDFLCMLTVWLGIHYPHLSNLCRIFCNVK